MDKQPIFLDKRDSTRALKGCKWLPLGPLIFRSSTQNSLLTKEKFDKAHYFQVDVYKQLSRAPLPSVFLNRV